ncbi:phosphatidate cytidylyltransferase [bacterium MnTg02]|nr:phosphatidate cytidylyltransferase [bacterium MnTg02]
MIGPKTQSCDDGKISKPKHSEVSLRFFSAAVLASIALATTYAGGWPFAILIAFAGVVMSWEWSGITCKSHQDAWFFLLASAAISATFLTSSGWPEVAVVVIVTGALLAGLLASRFADLKWIAAGILFVGAPSIALVWLRQAAHYGPDYGADYGPDYGWWSILFVFAVVWATDSAAYAAGRLIGGAKLSPKISPNKTWAGFWGGLLAAMVAGGLFALAPVPSSALTLALVAGFLSLAAQIGDLAESALKRKFGTKDASSLIPGHGGLLDRVDGLVFAAIAAAGLSLVLQSGLSGQGIFI